jgi:signal transduction histidine kinase
MSLTFERKLPLVLLIVFLMLTMIGFVFYQSTVSRQEAINWEKHSTDVLLKLDETLTLTYDSEIGVRRFIVTSNETYLDPYKRGKVRFSENLTQLRTLTAGNPVQQQELRRLEGLINSFNENQAGKVALRKEKEFIDSYESLTDARGKALIDEIRLSVERLKAEELRSLHERELNLDYGLSQTIWIFIAGCVAGLIALAVANYLVFRETKRRQLAEVALREVNRGLEQKVEERTVQLTEANRSLQEVGSEREQLLASEQTARKDAEIANRLRDEFMATVSHELRSPINAIVGWAKLMKAGKLNEEQTAKALDTIIKNSEAQTRLIKDLMDVARVISGKLELEVGDVRPEEIVTLAAESVKPSANQKHIEMEVEIADSLRGQTLRGDKTRLLQVFSNILTNAVKFTPESGAINVAARRVNGHLEVEVSDTGIGISPEFLPLVFERFRQDTTAARKSGGLGLGLAIVRNLVERHGGSVKVESEGENKGATFVVSLPFESQN